MFRSTLTLDNINIYRSQHSTEPDCKPVEWVNEYIRKQQQLKHSEIVVEV